jgi:hypothetical protein
MVLVLSPIDPRPTNPTPDSYVCRIAAKVSAAIPRRCSRSRQESAGCETWSFSFTADSNPAVLEFGNGGFDFAFSNFTYSLNGSPVAIAPTAIRFFTAANGGGFFICFVQPCGMGVFPNGLTAGGPQLYTGPNSAPTLLPGPFISLPFAVAVNSIGYGEANITLQASVPEPSTLLMLAAGLLGFVGLRLFWRS